MGYLVLAALAWLVYYVLACWIWPYRNCSHCHGRGRRESPSGRAFRNCWWCSGAGRKLRFGRRLWTFVRAGWHE